MRARTATAAVATLLAGALALTGCGRAGQVDPATRPGVTLDSAPAAGTVTMWAMGAEGTALPEFVKGFEAANPGVKVNVTPIPWDAARNKFQTAIAGSSTPDIAMMGTTWMAEFTDAFATAPTNVDTSDSFKSAVDTTRVGGRAAGLPWYVDTRVLYYRTDLAKQAGWDKAPATWDDLKALASDYKTKAGTKWGIRLQSQGADVFQGNTWLPLSAGAKLSDGTQWTLDSDAWVKGMDFYRSFFAEGLANPSTDPATAASTTDFVSGATPMIVEGPFFMSQVNEVGGEGFQDKYATVTVPQEESSTSFTGGSNLVVFEDSKNKDAAWKLAAWLNEPEQQLAWFKKTGDLPASQSAWKDPALSQDTKLAAFGEQLKTAVAPPAVASWSRVSASADSLTERISRGMSTPAEALTSLQQKASSIGYVK